ncbi:MAG: 3-hydroxyacyl-CoA dehydrogenase family protein [Spirochaetales bacterium]|nr:3-hydroxyacyl-CoA dehydrogenase family protein [Spirochaetales bacterium]
MIQCVGVIGTGKMGTNILDYLLHYDFKLRWKCHYEKDVSVLDSLIDRKVKRVLKMQERYDENTFIQYRGRIQISSSIYVLKGCDLIIESVTEDKTVKTDVFRQLNQIITPETICVTNTSSLDPGLLFQGYNHKNRCGGYHFFYPIHYKNIVEINCTEQTDKATREMLIHFSESIKKQYLILDEPDHFILNRIFCPLQAQAYLFLQEGILTVDELDSLIREKVFPIGVFEFIDSVGIDIISTSVKNYLSHYAHKEFFNPWIEAMEQMVATGNLGKKSGQGFYRYLKGGKQAMIFNNQNKNPQAPGEYKQRVTDMLEALYLNGFCHETGNIPPGILDNAIKEYWGMDTGPLDLLKKSAINQLRLMEFYKMTGNEFYKPAAAWEGVNQLKEK